MRILFFLAASAILLGSCSSFQPIGYQNSVALQSDQTLYRDVFALYAAKADNPLSAYNPAFYGLIQADITNCVTVYGTIPKSGLSLTQLAKLSDAVQRFKTQDSLGAHASFFKINAPLLLQIAYDIDTLETSKLAK